MGIFSSDKYCQSILQKECIKVHFHQQFMKRLTFSSVLQKQAPLKIDVCQSDQWNNNLISLFTVVYLHLFNYEWGFASCHLLSGVLLLSRAALAMFIWSNIFCFLMASGVHSYWKWSCLSQIINSSNFFRFLCLNHWSSRNLFWRGEECLL